MLRESSQTCLFSRFALDSLQLDIPNFVIPGYCRKGALWCGQMVLVF